MFNFKQANFCFVAVLSLFIQTKVIAQDFKHEFGFKSDNDSYLANGQDRYYTNGLFISYRKAAQNFKKRSSIKKIYEIEIGQKMYNAQSGYIPAIQYVDRPITAFLYLGGNMEWYSEHETMFKVGLQIGTIGPAALGRQAQEFVHRITGLYTPKGWEYQLHNELGLNLSVAYAKMIQRANNLKMDLSWHGFANLGNTFTGAGIGFTLRSGRVNQLFQSAYNRSNIASEAAKSKLTVNEFFVFAKPQLDWVVYDASISGGLFVKDKGPITYTAKPWVLSQEFGLMYGTKRLSAKLSYIFKTPEIKSAAKAHQYGSISTYYRFK